MRFGWLLLACVVIFPVYGEVCLPGYMVVTNNSVYECQISCLGGYYLANANEPQCTPVGAGYWAPASSVKQGNKGVRYKCPDGLTTSGYGGGADDENDCGRVIYVGGENLYLRRVRYSTPAMVVFDGKNKYYAGATKLNVSLNENSIHKLNALDENNVKYSIYDASMEEKVMELSSVFDYADYNIKDGKILSVNPAVYLESTGGQYIDTHEKGSTKNIYELNFQLTRALNGALFGMRNNPIYYADEILSYTWATEMKLNSDTIMYLRPKGANLVAINVNGGDNLLKTRLIVDIPNNRLQYNDKTYTLANSVDWETKYDLFLFCNNVGGTTITKPVAAKIYSYKVSDLNGNILMHLVPVPRGLSVGDYVVPASGMWDIVSQKYFPNMGEGFFLYGRDE